MRRTRCVGGAYRLAHLFGGDDGLVRVCHRFDRVMVSIGEFSLDSGTVVGVVSTPEARERALEVARAFRGAGVRTEVNLMQRGMGAQIAHAAKTADFAVVLGKREVDAGTVTLRDLHSGEQRECGLEEAIAEVAQYGDR